jgi:hypothetical protein
MGLKTINYKVPTGDTLETAYAIFDDIEKIGKDKFRAYFKIYRERANIEEVVAYQTKRVEFVWDRQTDLVAMAYAESKKPKEVTRWNKESQKFEKIQMDNIFTGWEDDIIK